MDFFENAFDFYDFRNGAFYESPVYSALLQGEAAALQALQELTKPLSLRESARCLLTVLSDGSPELFRQLLEHSEPGECMDQYYLSPLSNGRGLNGRGSMLMLAAMLDRPRHAQLLLEHGYNCNGASLELAHYVQQVGQFWTNFVPDNARYCATICNQINANIRSHRDIGISCATPLAAALLCGSLQTAQVLLNCPGIWKGESSAVCRAAAMVLEGKTCLSLTPQQQDNQREILRLIFCPDRTELPPKEVFLQTVYLQPDSFIDFCSTRTLRCQLESGLCTPEDGKRMLEIFGNHPWLPHRRKIDRSTAGKLLLLKQYFPEICRQPWATGIFLRECFLRCRTELPYQTLMAAWRQLCGKERDLTWLGENLWLLNLKALRQFLTCAADGGTLVMDADAIGPWCGTQYRATLEVLNRIRFRYRHTDGVSGLTSHLLGMKDLRILQHGAKRGFFQHENPKALMEELLASKQASQDVRTIVLTYAPKGPAPHETQDWQNPRRWEHWRRWEPMEEKPRPEELERLLHQPLSREECLWLLFRLYQHMNQDFFTEDISLADPKYPTLVTNSLAAISCCAHQPQVMELMLEHLPHKLAPSIRACWGSQFFFQGSPLTLSAALGRTQQVRMLLDSGLHPDEEGNGNSSRFFLPQKGFSKESIPVTPILAAILFGEEATAKLLLERGAVCDFSRPSHRKVLLQGSAKSLALAETLPGIGFENIPHEELNAIRILTGEQGAQSHFWESLEQDTPSCEDLDLFPL